MNDKGGNEMFTAKEEFGLAGPAVVLILLAMVGVWGGILYGLVYLVGWVVLKVIGLV